MSEPLSFKYDVQGGNFASAGQASVQVKKNLRQIGISPEIIRRISIAMYEGEINMVIHAGGGEIDVEITESEIIMTLADKGPGIADLELAMKEGYSTAPDNVRSLGFGAGMGLPNIKKYSDEFRVDTVVGEGTTLHLKVYIQ